MGGCNIFRVQLMHYIQAENKVMVLLFVSVNVLDGKIERQGCGGNGERVLNCIVCIKKKKTVSELRVFLYIYLYVCVCLCAKEAAALLFCWCHSQSHHSNMLGATCQCFPTGALLTVSSQSTAFNKVSTATRKSGGSVRRMAKRVWRGATNINIAS